MLYSCLNKYVEAYGDRIDYMLEEGTGAVVCSVKSVTADDYASFISAVGADFKFVCTRSFGTARFHTYRDGDTALYTAFYPSLGVMRVVIEAESAYLSLSDDCSGAECRPLLTQVDLEDYGLSYVVRTCDGRFIIFDGGWEFEPDADELYRVLCEQSPSEMPVIAAWVMTHPHVDHYRCFFWFYKKYGDKVKIQRFLYNFPDPNADAELIPLVLHSEEFYHMTRLNDIVKHEISENGAVFYRPHTGQVYEFGGVRMEVLTSPDDAFKPPVSSSNNISLVMKLTVLDQTILMTGDSQLKYVRLAERMGDYLKCDILQLTHHGFSGGNVEVYRLADPHTVVAPVFEREMFGTMNLYKDHNLPLIYDQNVADFYVGGRGTFTLRLPYTPRPNGRALLFEAIERQRSRCGACTWFYCDMTLEDAKFTFVNSISVPIQVRCDLFFENKAENVSAIQIEVPGFSFARRDLANPADIDDNALYFNRNALIKKGIKPGAVFALRFTCDVPFVVKGVREADFCK